jgi:NAD(P)-dependent dehydrogenase (short-subunit alcohol dehydrogenase family)
MPKSTPGSLMITPPSFSIDLSGHVALVTGASSGLGQRFAETLALSGAAVAVGGRRIERLEELATRLREAGATCEPVQMDMTEPESILTAVDHAAEVLGTVDILVNNAGVPDAARAHKMPLDLIDRVFDTNLRGPYILSCEVARRLIDAKQPGRMVNISSMGALNYDGNGAALYSITKAGIIRMTEALAVEWSRYHINVNAIAPGAFSSEMMDGMLARLGDFTQAFPRKRMGQPHQLDSTLLYLVSPASEVVTGTVITADDGQMPR